MTFTVMCLNYVLGTFNCSGTYATSNEAAAVALASAKRTRTFCRYEVWEGTPRNPNKPVKGLVYEGQL